jgi:GAF domain-containing protein
MGNVGVLERVGLLGSLEAVATQLADPLQLDRIAAVVSDATWTTLGAPVFVLVVREEAGQHLRPVHVRGVAQGAELAAILVKAWRILAGSPETFSPALAAFPIPPAGRRFGVMLVGARDRRLTDDEHAYLTVLAALLGVAVQRLSRGRREPAAGSHLRVGDLDIDLGEQRVVVGERDARLTPSEIRLLLFLAEEPGQPRTRHDILRHMWHTEHVVDERACDAHVSNLRRKIERDPSHPERLVTVRSVGYALRPM